MSKRRRTLFLVLALLWLCVIWGHSVMPASESKAESGGIVAWLAQYLPWVTDRLVRKAAHFTEYLIFGGLVFGAYPERGRTAALLTLLAGLCAAFFDETIQLFAPGRSGQIRDVWLDLAGFCTSQLLLRLLWRKRSE